MKTFLFQGDSITDAGRNRDYDGEFGNGYPTLMAADYLKNHPNEFDFINRAESGDRVVDIYARIRRDLINLKPDYVSILVGINDVWHEVSNLNGVAAPKYEIIYSMIVEEIKEYLPATKIIILEPFVLNGTATSGSWGYFKEEAALRATAADILPKSITLHSFRFKTNLTKLVKTQKPRIG